MSRSLLPLLLILAAPACNFDASPQPVVRTASAGEAPAQRKDVLPGALSSAMSEGEVILIDVRTQREWDAGHIEGARHIPLNTISPDHPDIQQIPKDATVYMICGIGVRSARAANILADSGWQDVRNVVGGMDAWSMLGN